jgi:hypothetical protein
VEEENSRECDEKRAPTKSEIVFEAVHAHVWVGATLKEKETLHYIV